MTTSPSSAPGAGNPRPQAPLLPSADRAFLPQIAHHLRHSSPPTWKRHWQARYGLPPHPQFVRFVKHAAPTLSLAELLRHLEREHRLEVRAQAALRQDFRHAQPDRYRVLLREVREGLRDSVALPVPPRAGPPHPRNRG